MCGAERERRGKGQKAMIGSGITLAKPGLSNYLTNVQQGFGAQGSASDPKHQIRKQGFCINSLDLAELKSNLVIERQVWSGHGMQIRRIYAD